MRFSKKTLTLISNFKNLPQETIQQINYKSVLPIQIAINNCISKYLSPNKKNIIDSIQRNWEIIIPSPHNTDCTPYKYDQYHCLWIRAYNSSIKQKLSFEQSTILSNIKKIKYCKNIKTVKFIL